ncbi:peptidylprolyl isomerase [Pseudonocardiaceae bacterium YIM PH 21723]|nr:peptidylprolyl isomerase [Pseudonocardiaceae bacterium YIM PH 21723]
MRNRWIHLATATALLGGLLAAPAQAETATGATCTYTRLAPNPDDRPQPLPRPKASNRGTATVTLETNAGDITVKLDRANAPCAVHSFLHLIDRGFFDETRCWRLTNDTRLGVLQCGDLVKAEIGGPGYRFDDEVTGKETYPRGTLAMGNQGPGTNGSEFFLVHSFANIKPAYTVLGQVTEGLDTLDRIVARGIKDGKGDGEPARPVRIWSIDVDEE